MGELVRYFRGLQVNAIIDPEIINAIKLMGLAPTIDREMIQSHQWVSCSRISSYKYNFTFIPWIADRICYDVIIGNRDFISTKFSGCYMVVYKNSHGLRCGAHIHIGGTNECKIAWNNYIRGIREPECTLHLPSYGLSYWYGGNEIWGIISNDNRCYTVIVSLDRNNNYMFRAIREKRPYSDIRIL